PSDGFDGLSGHFFVCCQYKTKRPEQVGAFAWAFISVFSHSLLRSPFFMSAIRGLCLHRAKCLM
ncbi:hypothetical protein, partial [Pseudomonas syringae group genomosp. 3]|uniref:hypothetical protein n=1 Tax=Pseudomonas syringae group genomosp. 3 TaxID=251701 RepID=UPI001F364F3F